MIAWYIRCVRKLCEIYFSSLISISALSVRNARWKSVCLFAIIFCKFSNAVSVRLSIRIAIVSLSCCTGISSVTSALSWNPRSRICRVKSSTVFICSLWDMQYALFVQSVSCNIVCTALYPLIMQCCFKYVSNLLCQFRSLLRFQCKSDFILHNMYSPFFFR